MRRLWWILGLVTALGCAATDKSATNQHPAMRALGQEATVEKGASDEGIGREIRRRLELADTAGTVGVIVEVNEGNVTLRGVTPSLAVAWQAEAAARATAGVKQVANHILVHARSVGY